MPDALQIIRTSPPFEEDHESERRALKSDLLQRVRKVVEAEGGKPGAKPKVSRRKNDVLLKLEKAFEP